MGSGFPVLSMMEIDGESGEGKGTYWNPVMASRRCHASRIVSGRTGIEIAEPTSNSCRAVLILEISVGFTSAEGREKSQYRAMVFGGGSDIHL